MSCHRESKQYARSLKLKITSEEFEEVIKNCKFALSGKTENISFCAVISNPVYSDASPRELIQNTVRTLLCPFPSCGPMELIHTINYRKNSVNNYEKQINK